MTGLFVGLLLCLAVAVLWQGPVTIVVPTPSGGSLPAASGPATGEAGASGRAAASGGGMSAQAVPAGIRDPALMLDLSAAMFSAGRPLSTVLLVLGETADPPLRTILRRVVTALELGAGWEQAWELGARTGGETTKEAGSSATVLRNALAFAASSGAPSAAVLHAQASQIRRRGPGRRNGVRQHWGSSLSCRWASAPYLHFCVSQWFRFCWRCCRSSRVFAPPIP